MRGAGIPGTSRDFDTDDDDEGAAGPPAAP
jgi:hypothetical protein